MNKKYFFGFFNCNSNKFLVFDLPKIIKYNLCTCRNNHYLPRNLFLCRIFFNFITTSKISRVKQVLISLISRLIKVFCVRSESATVKSPSVLHPKKLSRSCMSNITNLDKVDPFADAAKVNIFPCQRNLIKIVLI